MPSLPASQRKTHILDAAQKLFEQKGYGSTTIEDILAGTGIAKGTLYYHFKNKEAIMDAIIVRTADAIVARGIAALESNATPEEKFARVIQSARVEANEQLLEEMHQPAHSAFHVRSVVYTVQQLAPVLAQVIAEGIAAGAFQSEQPLEDAEFLLVAGFMLTDVGFFPADAQQLQRRTVGAIHAAERLLGCAPGALLAEFGG